MPSHPSSPRTLPRPRGRPATQRRADQEVRVLISSKLHRAVMGRKGEVTLTALVIRLLRRWLAEGAGLLPEGEDPA